MRERLLFGPEPTDDDYPASEVESDKGMAEEGQGGNNQNAEQYKIAND